MDASRVQLLRLLSLLTEFSEEEKQKFLALYVLIGDNIFFLLHLFKGTTVQFSGTRKYKKLASVSLTENEIQYLTDISVLSGMDGIKLGKNPKISKGDHLLIVDDEIEVLAYEADFFGNPLLLFRYLEILD